MSDPEIILTAEQKRRAKAFQRFFRGYLAVRPRSGYRYRQAELSFSLQELYSVYHDETASPVPFPIFTTYFRLFVRTVPNQALRALFQKDHTGVWWYGARLKTVHERRRYAKDRAILVAKLTTVSRAFRRSSEGIAYAQRHGAGGDRLLRDWFLDRLVAAKGERLAILHVNNRSREETGVYRRTWAFLDLLQATIDCAEFLRENIFVLTPDLYGVAFAEPEDTRPTLRALLGGSEGTPVPDDTI